MNKTELAYIAGFFDGEGSVGIYGDGKHLTGELRQRLQVTVGQSGNECPIILDTLKNNFGGSITKQIRKDRTKTIWYWRIGSGKAADFLRQIEPYLIVKYNQVLVALEFAKLLDECKSLSGQCGNINRERKNELILKKIEFAQQIKELKYA